MDEQVTRIKTESRDDSNDSTRETLVLDGIEFERYEYSGKNILSVTEEGLKTVVEKQGMDWKIFNEYCEKCSGLSTPVIDAIEKHLDEVGFNVSIEMNCEEIYTTPEPPNFYRVFDTNKLAKFPECNVDPSWNQCDYGSFNEAENYAINWLGHYAPDHGVLKLNTPFKYGMDSFVVITKVDRPIDNPSKETKSE